MGETKASLVFKVKRQPPELIPPAAPTPHEFKELSDLDDQESLRYQLPLIFFYSGGSAPVGRDPVRVIKEALAKALVPYYPFAGRLREKEGRKLVVECTGEGILFIEADADVTLNDFGDALYPPIPCFEELLCDVPGSSTILHSPLWLFQVTRLKCGGFVLAFRFNHTMADGPGIAQFMKGVGELARGARSISVWPVWERHLLCARNPPSVTCVHREYDEVPDTKGTLIPLDKMAQKSYFFGPSEMTAIKRFVPPQRKPSSTFEVLAATIWRCRTIAIQPDPEEEVRVMCLFNIRSRLFKPSILPPGYYGNGFAFPVAIATAHNLTRNPLGYALELVKKTKSDVSLEYIRSNADLMVTKGRPHLSVVRSIAISDNTKPGYAQLDYGWGPPVFGGPAQSGGGVIPGVAFFIPHNNKNKKGERGIVVPMCLPADAMERFDKEIQGMLCDATLSTTSSSRFISSSL